jgi:hypothetical protein
VMRRPRFLNEGKLSTRLHGEKKAHNSSRELAHIRPVFGLAHGMGGVAAALPDNLADHTR